MLVFTSLTSLPRVVVIANTKTPLSRKTNKLRGVGKHLIQTSLYSPRLLAPSEHSMLVYRHSNSVPEYDQVEMHLLKLAVVLGPLLSSSAVTVDALASTPSRRAAQRGTSGADDANWKGEPGFESAVAQQIGRPKVSPIAPENVKETCNSIWRLSVEFGWARPKADECETRLSEERREEKYPGYRILSEKDLALKTFSRQLLNKQKVSLDRF